MAKPATADRSKAETFKPRAVIVDIDGTVADSSHRDHLLKPGDFHGTPPEAVKEWKRLVHKDAPIPHIVELVRTLHTAGYAIVMCTARGTDMYEGTNAWLKSYGVPFDDLYMTVGYHATAVDTKRASLARIREKYEPFLVIEDHAGCVQMFREQGITALQCITPGVVQFN